MSFPFYIAKRYLFTKSSNNAINFITLIAAFGIIIGAAALFIVLSGFAGLKDFTLKFSSYVDPDLKIIPLEGKTFRPTSDQLEILSNNKDVLSYTKILEERVLLNYENKNESVLLKGVDEGFPQKTIDSILFQGQWFDATSNEIVVGWGVSNTLSIGILDFSKPLSIYVPKPGKGQITSTRSAFNSMTVVNTGVFQINEDLDYSTVYTSFDLVKNLLNYEADQVSAIEVITTSPEVLDDVKSQLENVFGDKVQIKDRVQLNDSLYKMLNSENLAVYLIFTLVLIIALFNVIGSIIMMILDKKKNLNTLFNLGVSVKDIRKIFFLQGSLMTVLGGFIGVGLGLVLVLLQKSFSLVMITASLPYPVRIEPLNILLVFLTIAILGVLASKLASARISNQLVTEI